MSIYTVNDVKTAALLTTLGYKPLTMHKIGATWEFKFEDAGDAREAVADFLAGKQGVADSQKLLEFYDAILTQVKEEDAQPAKVESRVRHGAKEYSVRNAGTAALLKCAGFKYLRTETVGAVSTVFVFQDDGTASTFEEQFHSEICLVEAKAFAEALRILKAQDRKLRKRRKTERDPAA